MLRRERGQLQALRDVQWDLSLNDYTEVAFPLDLLILDLAILRMSGCDKGAVL